MQVDDPDAIGLNDGNVPQVGLLERSPGRQQSLHCRPHAHLSQFFIALAILRPSSKDLLDRDWSPAYAFAAKAAELRPAGSAASSLVPPFWRPGRGA